MRKLAFDAVTAYYAKQIPAHHRNNRALFNGIKQGVPKVFRHGRVAGEFKPARQLSTSS
jgi:hypothetical protein